MSTALRGGAGRNAAVTVDRATARPSHTRQVLIGGFVGLAVGLLVVLPWVQTGYLLLLDWISGPNQAVTAGLYGINGDQVDGLPWRLAVQGLRTVVGPSVTAWLLILAFFPLAGAGIAHVVRGTTAQTVVAALVMTCNPMVVTRVAAGHVPYLIGVACLPWLLAAALNARKRNSWFSVRTAGWYALGLAVTPHMAWLGGMTLLLVTILPRPNVRGFVRLILVTVAAATVYAYGIVIWLTGVRVPNVGAADLSAYATRPGDAGLLVTVLSLRGFWRQRTIDVGASLGLWWIPIVIAVFVLVFVGLGGYARDRAVRGPILFGMMAFGIVASCGAAGPFGWLYRWAFDTLPLFAVMREPLKWLPMILIPMAAGLARAVPIVAASFSRWRRGMANSGPGQQSVESVPQQPKSTRGMTLLAGLVCSAAALACLPGLVFGLGGRIETSKYPQGWYDAQQTIGSGTGSVLFLPWHGYQSFEFTDGRSVATPGRAFFTRQVISSQAVELGSEQTDTASARSHFLDQVLAIGSRQRNLGALLGPLGVEYVAVATSTGTPENYAWLTKQGGMTQVLRNRDMTVYRVDRAATGRVIGARQSNVRQLVTLADQGRVGTEAVLPDGPVRPPVPSADQGRLAKVSATEWQVSAGTPGWVVVPEDWSAGWRIGDRSGVQTTQGLVAFYLDGSPASITFRPWRFIAPAVAVSAIALLVLVVIGLLQNRAGIRRFWSSRSVVHREGSDDRGASGS